MEREAKKTFWFLKYAWEKRKKGWGRGQGERTGKAGAIRTKYCGSPRNG